jgi:hypothetical protein
MYGLIHNIDLAEPLAKKILRKHLGKMRPQWENVSHYVQQQKKIVDETNLLQINFATVNELLQQDIKQFKDQIAIEYKKRFRKLTKWLADRMDDILSDPKTRQQIIDLYVGQTRPNLITKFAPQVFDSVSWVTTRDQIDQTKPMVLRNVIHNENILKQKLEQQLPFWFIETGYTNFLENGRKKWHRVVHNHIHHQLDNRYFPADRLSLLPSWPRPWRRGGSYILVVESSNNFCTIFNQSLGMWRESVRSQIQKYTDRPIEFRSKLINKKTRKSLYEDLANSDHYYCVISQSSAAAIEAIWLGIPVITLGTHITSPVARNNIADVNNLYRGPIGDWLCALTYSQFTAKEIYKGTARKILAKYHNV